MLDYSNGNSFGDSGNGTGQPPPWPVPPWKLGLRWSDDRGDI
jgi:hypothetical protein